MNAIALGSTRTDGANLVVDEAGWERRRQKVPLGRLGEPDDIANPPAVFFAGNDPSCQRRHASRRWGDDVRIFVNSAGVNVPVGETGSVEMVRRTIGAPSGGMT